LILHLVKFALQLDAFKVRKFERATEYFEKSN